MKRAMCGRFCHAAHQSGLSGGTVPFRRSGIPHHHLPYRSAEIARACAGAAADRRALGQIRIYPHAGFGGFGDYTESGQVIPVTFKGRKGGYSHCMFLDDHPPIAGGRELWGFPKKLAKPTLHDEIDTPVGTLDYGPVRIATGSMGYKHKVADHDAVMASLVAPNFLLKIVPHVDGTPRICELVEYELTDVNLKGAWTGPAALTLSSHALAPLAELPVLEIVSGMHILADLTLPLGKVVHDYLA
jgi:acetoacetate decarboxylase